MNASDLKQLLDSQSGGTSQADLINQAIAPMMPMLKLLFVGGIILSIIVAIYFIINLVQKQHTHRAILRIDKNLQRLVDNQLGPEESEHTRAPQHEESIQPIPAATQSSESQ
jgi:hypothetical protein